MTWRLLIASLIFYAGHMLAGGSLALAQETTTTTEPEPTTTTTELEATTTTTEATTTTSSPESTTTTVPSSTTSSPTTTPPESSPDESTPRWDDGMTPSDYIAHAVILGTALGTVVGGSLSGRRF